MSDVSQISDQCEPVCKRKGITSYKYGTSGTSSCSEYESSKVSENKTDRDKRRDTNQRKKKQKIADMQNKLTNIKKEINDNKKKGIKPKPSHTRKRRSVVWSKGAFKGKPGDMSKVICEQCALQGKAHEQERCKNSTTALRRHL